MKKPLRKQWALALALGLSSSLNAQTRIPQTMAASGDSLTAAALAAFKRSDAHNPILIAKFLFLLGKIGYMGSLHAFEARQRSWATGDGSRVRSHARRLMELNEAQGTELKAYNAAVSGATSYDIQEQIDAILKWSRKTTSQNAPDYVLLAIGANDACYDTNEEMTPTSTYSNHVRNAVYKTLDANPNTRILISGIPNLEHLRNVAENSWLGLPPLSKCKDIWAVHKFCNNVLLENDPAKRHEVTLRLIDYHKEIEKIRLDANNRYGKDRVRFSQDVYNYKFSDDDISIDCFHPNSN